jgi:putative sigma-54 modulation protein
LDAFAEAGLNLKIHSHNVELEDADRAYAEAKVAKLERHYGRILEGRLEVEADGLRRPEPVKTARLHLHLNPGAVLEARVEGRTVREAIDLVLDKMDAQLRRHKERLAPRHSEAT